MQEKVLSVVKDIGTLGITLLSLAIATSRSEGFSLCAYIFPMGFILLSSQGYGLLGLPKQLGKVSQRLYNIDPSSQRCENRPKHFLNLFKTTRLS